MNDHLELLMPFLEVIKLDSRPEEVVERPEVVAFLERVGAPLPSPAGAHPRGAAPTGRLRAGPWPAR